MTKLVIYANDSGKLALLMERLLSPRRGSPVIVITTRVSGGSCISPERVQKLVGDTAQVFLLSPQLLLDFNEQCKNIFGIYPAGMRIYKSRMTLNDSHARHPIINEKTIDDLEAKGEIDAMILRHVNDVRRFVNGRDTMRVEKPSPYKAIERKGPPRRILTISLNGCGDDSPSQAQP